MDWLINDALPTLARIFIVWIFPFSFLDKIINWNNALKQANSFISGRSSSSLAMVVELHAPMIVFGFYDGIAASSSRILRVTGMFITISELPAFLVA